MAAAIFAAFVDDVDEAVAIDGAVVRRLPLELFGELGPAVVDDVAMVAFAEDDFGVGLRRRDDGWGSENGGSCGGGGFHEVAAIERIEEWTWA